MANPGAISNRMGTTVRALAPVVAAVSSRKESPPADEDINLGDGENTLMKLEMVGICREVMQRGPDIKVHKSLFFSRVVLLTFKARYSRIPMGSARILR